MIKVEYHANDNSLKNSEKNCICWTKVNVSNNRKIIIPYYASFFNSLTSRAFTRIVSDNPWWSYVFGNFLGTTWYGSANHTIHKQDGSAHSCGMVQPIAVAVDMLPDVLERVRACAVDSYLPQIDCFTFFQHIGPNMK